MLAEFQTQGVTYVITNTKIYQSFPQVILYFNEITHLKFKENEDGKGGDLTIYANNKVISFSYKSEQVALINQLLKEIKQQNEEVN